MIALPNPPRAGDPIAKLADYLQQLNRALRAMRIVPSADLMLTETPSGSFLRLRRAPATVSAVGTGDSTPWMFRVCASAGEAIASTTPVTISVAAGTAQALYGQITQVSALSQVVAIAPDETAYVYLTFTIASADSGEYTNTFSPSPTIATTLPQNTWTTRYLCLATVSATGEVLQGHLGGVYLPGVVPLVDQEPADDSPDDAS